MNHKDDLMSSSVSNISIKYWSNLWMPLIMDGSDLQGMF